MPGVAIAILNYNGENHLKQFLPTLIANSKGCPIYIGDNASVDDSVKLLKEYFPSTICVELGDNFGYSGGYNRLIKHISEEFIILVNSDIEVTEGWIEPLIGEFKNDKVAAIQPKIRSYHKKEYFEYAGAAGGYIDKYGYPFCRGRLFNSIEKDTGQYDDAEDISWASGACFAIRKSAFDQVGGFDDDFFAHMEEIDLCWRLHTYGYSIRFTPESIVYHVGGGTLDYGSPFKTYLNYRNGLYLLLKNLPEKKRDQVIVVRVLLDWLSALLYLAQGKWKFSRAIMNAHKEVRKNRSNFLAKRINNIEDKGFRHNLSIVWEYFIKGKKEYRQLNNTRLN